MKGSILTFLVLLVFILAGCNPDSSVSEPIATTDKSAGITNSEELMAGKFAPETLQELAIVRRVTAKYHNIDAALADGYVDINVVIPGMGHHYLKSAYLNATFEVDKPELLVYAPAPNGGLRLVAVEFAVPVVLSANAPEGFTGSDDVWVIVEGGPGPEDDLWTLHAWVWYHNPAGMFNPINPRLL